MYRLTSFLTGILILVATADRGAAQDVMEHFERHVRPLLAEHCWECHGEKKQEAGLRLDTLAGLRAGSDSGPILNATTPDAGTLWQVLQPGAETTMPPENPLRDQQRQAIEAWLRAGAPWPADDASPSGPDQETVFANHWAFQPLGRPALPQVADRAWPRSAIDRFVLAQLESAGLTPSPAADRATWLKRVSVDLTGLLPDQASLVSIVADPRDTDTVLAAWTDQLLASPAYGERWGRHWLDVARYADTKDYQDAGEGTYPLAWTYRDYVIRALNDDLPFDRFVLEQLAADRLDLADSESWRLAALGFLTVGRRFNHNDHDRIDDQMDATLRGFMGLTVGCARCHDHKFDPISIRDYYRLYSVFGNTQEPPLPDRPVFHSPLGPPPAYPQATVHEDKLTATQAALNSRRDELRDAILNELRSFAADYLEYLVQQSPLHRTRDDVSLVTERTTIRDRAAYSQGAVAAWRQFLDTRSVDDPVFGLYRSLWETPPAEFSSRLSSLLEHRGTANAVVVQELATNPPQNLVELARQLGTLLEQAHQRWQAMVASDPTASSLPEAEWEQLRQVLYGSDSPLAVSDDEFKDFYSLNEYMEVVKLVGDVEHVFAEAQAAAYPRPMSVQDRPAPREFQIMRRGDPLRLGDEVSRGLPSWFTQRVSAPEIDQGSGRRELAQWITSSENPLTARVLANRIWTWHFGQPLVDTPSNFGTRGTEPTQPELLDYLACELQASDWSLKSLHRKIVLSSTYRQASLDRPEMIAQDPANRRLWRMPRRRLEWEVARDCWLQASGQLDRRLGGLPDRDLATPRRSIYQRVVRVNPPALLQTFDVATSEFSVGRRSDTTTVQQALFLMNHPWLIQLSQELGDVLAAQAGEVIESQIDLAFERTLCRKPRPAELQAAIAFLNRSAAEQAEQLEELYARPNTWTYGYGFPSDRHDRVASFDPLPHFSGTAWQGGEKWPDEQLHYVQLTERGGHVGIDAQHATIRRWTAPRTGRISIRGTLVHGVEGETCGDGVEGLVISSRLGLLKHEAIHNDRVSMELADIEVAEGDTIDFVTSLRDNHFCDVFEWVPVIEWTGSADDRQPVAGPFDAAKDFSLSAPQDVVTTQTPLAQLIHALLISNEFLFVD